MGFGIEGCWLVLPDVAGIRKKENLRWKFIYLNCLWYPLDDDVTIKRLYKWFTIDYNSEYSSIFLYIQSCLTG